MQHKNEINIVGTLGSLNVRTTTKNGIEVVSLRMVTDEIMTRKFHNEWHSAFSYDEEHIAALRDLKPGAQLKITGANRTRSYEKDGVTHYSTEIRISTLEVLAEGSTL